MGNCCRVTLAILLPLPGCPNKILICPRWTALTWPWRGQSHTAGSTSSAGSFAVAPAAIVTRRRNIHRRTHKRHL